jgi:hypothetical protein
VAKKIDMTVFNTLSELLAELSDYEDKFCEFALQNERAVKVALYADSVLDEYAEPTDLLYSECVKSIELFRACLAKLENEDEL